MNKDKYIASALTFASQYIEYHLRMKRILQCPFLK